MNGILKPLLESWAYLAIERAILPIAHFQNLLLEIDQSGEPRRVVYRDLQDAAIDRERREKKGLHIDFARHFVDDATHHLLKVDGELIRDVDKVRRIRYSIAYDFWLGLVLSCFGIVLGKYPSASKKKIEDTVKELFRKKILPSAEDLFPLDQFWIHGLDPSNSGIRIVENKGSPIYR